MASPAFLVCDTDAVIQFLIAAEVRPFRFLRARYSIQPVLTPEVEIELKSNRRFGQRIAPDLKKALTTGLFRVLDRNILESYYGVPPAASMAASSALAQIAKVGKSYHRHVDYGEAYTHAAAVTLGAPALSNDLSALRALITAGLQVPPTVLRTFDLITFCYQVDHMSEQECDEFRAFLASEREYLPACFTHKSFGDGIKDFCPRICDIHRPPIGSPRVESYPFANVLDL